MVARLTLSLWLFAVAGCVSEQGVYEGLKSRERLLNPQDAADTEELPDYPAYEAERKRATK